MRLNMELPKEKRKKISKIILNYIFEEKIIKIQKRKEVLAPFLLNTSMKNV